MDYSDYDPRVAFNDIANFGSGSDYVGAAQHEFDPIEVAHRLLRRARSRRKRPASGSQVVLGVTDTTLRSFRPRLRRNTTVLGASPSNTPVFSSLYKQFADVLPSPKLARVDDIMSYVDFRSTRRAPYLVSLERKLTALEAAIDEGYDWVDVESAVRGFIAQASRGGDEIRLPIPEVETGQIECWQDGNEILCTIRIMCGDGAMRMVTSGTQVAEHAREILGCAAQEGVDRETVNAVAPSVVQVLGAAKLVEDLYGVAPMVIDSCQGQNATIGIVPAADPSIAAAMSLLQKCQQGDWASIADAKNLVQSDRDLMVHAANRLLAAQQAVASRRTS